MTRVRSVGAEVRADGPQKCLLNLNKLVLHYYRCRADRRMRWPHLIDGRATKLMPAFDGLLKDSGVEPVVLPPRESKTTVALTL